jgi:hypothetical protein
LGFGKGYAILMEVGYYQSISEAFLNAIDFEAARRNERQEGDVRKLTGSIRYV